jgi:hypothetical protein
MVANVATVTPIEMQLILFMAVAALYAAHRSTNWTDASVSDAASMPIPIGEN